MTLKLRKTDTAPVAAPMEPATTTISGWLAMVSGMLPRGQAQAIRDEIETHLTDRVRDLMVGGLNENEATKRAIAEFGEAADMAAKYRALQTEPQRRLVMYGSIFTACGAALALSIAAISGARTQPPVHQPVAAVDQGVPVLSDIPLLGTLYQTGKTQPGESDRLRYAVTFSKQPTSKEIADIRFDADFKEVATEDVFKFVGQVVNKPVHVYWDKLGELQIQVDTRVTLQAKQTGIEAVLRAVNEAGEVTSGKGDGNNTASGKVDWRLTDGVLEIASQELFDKREVKLTIYDISPIIAARIETYSEEREKIVQEVCGLLKEFVYADGWRDNGGQLAKMTIVGDRLFVEAPDRYHTQIRWMLDQLPSKSKHAQVTPLPVKTYALKHVKCTDVTRVIKDTYGPQYLAAVGLASDERTNTVIVSGGRAIQDELSELIAKMDVEARNNDGHAAAGAVRSYPMKAMSAERAAELVKQVFNVSPGLRHCEVERAVSYDSSTNALILKATEDQLVTVGKVLELIDREAPAELPPAKEASRQFMLKAVQPTAMRELLSSIFNESPGLKQCAVGRGMECNDGTGQFGLTATKDQVDVVDRLVTLLDRSPLAR